MKTNNKYIHQEKTFPAKVLLFGEHTILRGSKALAIPFFEKNCYWSWTEKREDASLLAFANYLEKALPGVFQIQELKEDIHQGLYLHSNIPNGYGLGSSGAVCVAIFHNYATEKGKALLELNTKSFFAKMEGFFHGSSSGTDPLIIHLGQSICLYGNGEYDLVKIPPLTNQYHFFLLDTQKPRKTAPLVASFMEKYDKKKVFRKLANANWSKPTDLAIEALLTGNMTELWTAFDKISRFQLEHLNEWVLPSLIPIWKKGLENQHYLLKICGAGGGGYCLGICKDFEKVKMDLNENRVIHLGLNG